MPRLDMEEESGVKAPKLCLQQNFRMLKYRKAAMPKEKNGEEEPDMCQAMDELIEDGRPESQESLEILRERLRLATDAASVEDFWEKLP